MGFAEEKYTEEYFLHCKKNPDGTTTPVNYGVLGIEEFREGKIPSRVINFLSSINFMDATVFEIGFGRGEALKYAREKGAKRCFGVDFSANAVKIAKEFLSPIQPNCPIVLICSDILFYIGYVATQSIDVVLMLDVIEHIPKQEAESILAHVNRILRPGGSLVIETPFYSIDEDFIAQSYKYKDPSPTDLIPETKGMHCNKFTEHRFYETLTNYGFEKKKNTVCTFIKVREI